MIYQHFPRENHEVYIKRRSNELHKETGKIPIFISDNEIIFFFIAKQEEVKNQLVEILKRYSSLYPRLSYGSK
jgi:hypothetical protein